MSAFLQFALEKYTKEGAVSYYADIAHYEDAFRRAGVSDKWAFFNATAVEIAWRYHHRQLTYDFCDDVMNDLWRVVIERYHERDNYLPEPLVEIYDAFGAGEYHRKHDRSDDPIAEFTDPWIADLVTRLNP